MSTLLTKSTRSSLSDEGEIRLDDSPSGVPPRAAFNSRDGRDEMNLVELPLSSIADRYLDGQKTVVLTEEIFDRKLGRKVERELSISGSDRYGLPTARDEDVLLACVQLSSADEFACREVSFARYELLRLLGWADEGKSYGRLATSLRRWKGVTVYSNRAFYDHHNKSWVNRDFGIFDNLFIYERESVGVSTARSWLLWNEVLYASFQAGYVKRLDWDLYCRLSSPIAKRLYRLLDKRFYFGDEVVMDLHQLAFRKIRLSDSYNTGQIKRALASAIIELETMWELRPLPERQRFLKLGRGRWQVVFRRRKPETRTAVVRREAQTFDLTLELTRRGLGPATAAELVAAHPEGTVRQMVELFDWYRDRKQEKGPGFLVDSIRHPQKYRRPRELVSPSGATVPRVSQPRTPCRQVRRAKPRSARPAQTESWRQGFESHWQALTVDERLAFEAAAVAVAATVKRDGYERLQAAGGQAFDDYRDVILRDYFLAIKSG